MKRITVELGERSYGIVVGERVLERSGDLLREAGFESAPVVVASAPVLDLHGERLLRSLGRAFGAPAVVRIGDGERHKSFATLQRLYSGLFGARADRRSWILAFGGGVTGDVAGFAAATYMRGIPYVQIPTTLLAQVDSSIGGKVGINCAEGKNLIGAFHQPRAVLADTAVLRTLPARELASGLFEVVKCGAIRSRPLLRFVESNLPALRRCRAEALERVVAAAAWIKAEVVSGDEREGGQRMILNYGHTIGHALEAATRYRRFTHGEAVGWGMIAALAFGSELGLLRRSESAKLAGLIRRIAPLPPLAGIPLRSVWAALGRDKKFAAGSIRMVLLRRLGQAEIRSDVDVEHLRGFLEAFLRSGGNA